MKVRRTIFGREKKIPNDPFQKLAHELNKCEINQDLSTINSLENQRCLKKRKKNKRKLFGTSIRRVHGSQMQCFLSMKNHGMIYLKHYNSAILRAEYRSNCKRSNLNVAYVLSGIDINPRSIKIQLDEALIEIMFRNEHINQNYSYFYNFYYDTVTHDDYLRHTGRSLENTIDE